jgi:hypothetical protein
MQAVIEIEMAPAREVRDSLVSLRSIAFPAL